MFKKRVLGLLVGLLAGLSALVTMSVSAQQDRPDRDPIDVQVINGQIVVAEDEAYTTNRHGGIVWRLVTPGYRFPDNGIVIDSRGKHRCGAGPNGQRFRCAKLRHDAGERYKYVVNVVEARSGNSLQPLDPWIVND